MAYLAVSIALGLFSIPCSMFPSALSTALAPFQCLSQWFNRQSRCCQPESQLPYCPFSIALALFSMPFSTFHCTVSIARALFSMPFWMFQSSVSIGLIGISMPHRSVSIALAWFQCPVQKSRQLCFNGPGFVSMPYSFQPSVSIVLVEISMPYPSFPTILALFSMPCSMFPLAVSIAFDVFLNVSIISLNHSGRYFNSSPLGFNPRSFILDALLNVPIVSFNPSHHDFIPWLTDLNRSWFLINAFSTVSIHLASLQWSFYYFDSQVQSFLSEFQCLTC